jgi:hypothetical protein
MKPLKLICLFLGLGLSVGCSREGPWVTPADLPRASLRIGEQTQAATVLSYCWSYHCHDTQPATPSIALRSRKPVRATLSFDATASPIAVSYEATAVTGSMARRHARQLIIWKLPSNEHSGSLLAVAKQEVDWNLAPGNYVVIVNARWKVNGNAGDTAHGFLLSVQP